MGELTIAEELMLLALDEKDGSGKLRLGLDWAVAGALVVDLVFARRITIGDDDVLTVLDPAATGKPHLDEALAALSRGEGMKVAKALRRTHRTAPRHTISSLVDRGVLARRPARLLGVLPAHRYPERDGSAAAEVRSRVNAAMLPGSRPDERTAALIGLLYSGKLWRKAVPGGDRAEVRARMKEISAGQRISPAVRQAIARTQAAIIAAVTSNHG